MLCYKPARARAPASRTLGWERVPWMWTGAGVPHSWVGTRSVYVDGRGRPKLLGGKAFRRCGRALCCAALHCAVMCCAVKSCALLCFGPPGGHVGASDGACRSEAAPGPLPGLSWASPGPLLGSILRLAALGAPGALSWAAPGPLLAPFGLPVGPLGALLRALGPLVAAKDDFPQNL